MALGPDDFNLRGSDSFHKGDSFDDNIFIAHVPLRRFISLKAFFNSISIECTKEVEKKEETNKNHTLIAEYSGKFDYSININIPAATVAEARNNVAKIEELQRLISRFNTAREGDGYRYIFTKSATSLPIFKVWFRNLVSNGKYYGSYPSTSEINFEKIDEFGLACYIDNVTYNPDMESGFFEDDRFLFPKNIILELKLAYISEDDANRSNCVAINGYTANGKYSADDVGAAPFGVITSDSESSAGMTGELVNNVRRFKESPEFTTDSMNINSSSTEGGREDTYLFISLRNDIARKRYVKFKGFIESHSRDYAVNIKLAESKNRNVGNSALHKSQPVSFKHLINKMKVNVPAANLNEAKKNCAKVQTLLRMFYKTHSDSQSYASKIKTLQDAFDKTSDAASRSIDKSASSLLGGRRDLQDSVSRTVWVHSPSFIEAPNAPYTVPSTYEGMYNAGLPMFMTTVNLEIDMEMGFFRDSHGRLFPKVLNLDFEFLYLRDDLVKNYYVENQKTYKYLGVSNGSPYKGKAAFYPFNRKTVKIGG